MKNIFEQIMSQFDKQGSNSVSTEKSLLIAGYLYIDESSSLTLDHEATRPPYWEKRAHHGYRRIKHVADNIDGDAQAREWSAFRLHYGGGVIGVSGLTLEQALMVKLPVPIHSNGTPLEILAPNLDDLDPLWFHATRAPTGNALDPGERKVVSIDTEKAKRLPKSNSETSTEHSTSADVISLFDKK